MGPPENPTGHSEKQEGRRKRLARRPRMRLCLLKGCELRFHPRQVRQRYCGEECREAARKWSRRKAQERYRETVAGQQNRNRQSRRYRERVKSRKLAEPEAVHEAARVITTEHFFRPFVRPARLLREIRAPAAKSPAALLLARVPARAGARRRARAALERGARLNPDILIRPQRRPYIQPVRCNWSFTNSTGAGSTCECATRHGSGGCWRRWPMPASKHPSWWWRPKARRTAMW
jgi:hypothetical protein